VKGEDYSPTEEIDLPDGKREIVPQPEDNANNNGEES
jgi:hypothetical protein